METNIIFTEANDSQNPSPGHENFIKGTSGQQVLCKINNMRKYYKYIFTLDGHC